LSVTNNLKYNIKYLLTNSNKNQTEFGKMFGVTQKMVSNWMSGYSNLTLDKLVNIAAEFDLSLDQLVFDRLDNPYNQYEDFVRKNRNYTLNDSKKDGPTYNAPEVDLEKMVLDNNEKITEIHNLLFNAENKMLLDKALEQLNTDRRKKTKN